MGVTALACAWVDAHALAQSRNAETPAWPLAAHATDSKISKAGSRVAR
jgi:hypothetical protein